MPVIYNLSKQVFVTYIVQTTHADCGPPNLCTFFAIHIQQKPSLLLEFSINRCRHVSCPLILYTRLL